MSKSLTARPKALGSSLSAAIFAALCLALLPASAAQSPQGQPGELLGAKQIDSLIKALSSKDFAEREAATLELCKAHGEARPALERVTADADAELAFRAKQILKLFDQLWFNGAEVSLAFDKSKVAWNEAVHLEVVISNPSPYPVRLPFARPRARGGGAQPIDRAEQVGRILDFADWLLIERWDGKRWVNAGIELTVDYAQGDTDIARLVESRANHNWPGSKLASKGTESLRLPSVNRGWARYKLLDKARYRFRLDFIPFWSEPSLEQARVGRVISNWAELEITKGAPETVARNGVPAAILLSRDSEGAILAALVNRYDHPQLINMNMGEKVPFANGRWLLHLDDQHTATLRSRPLPTDDISRFEASRIIRVEPGESVVLGRLPQSVVDAELKKRRLDGSFELTFSYRNLLDRHWQSQFGESLLGHPHAPDMLKEWLPSRMLVTSLTAPSPLLVRQGNVTTESDERDE
ncbi:MAG: hypothetical protein ACPGXK_09015 [Phycisphaerae bacterium]